MDPPWYSQDSPKILHHGRQSDSVASSNPYSDSGPELATVATIKIIHRSQTTENSRNAQQAPMHSQSSMQMPYPEGTPDASPPSSYNPDSTSNPYSDSGSIRSLMTMIKAVKASHGLRGLKDSSPLASMGNTSEESQGKPTHANMAKGAKDRNKDSEDSSISAAYYPSPTHVTFSPPSPQDSSGLTAGIAYGMYLMRALAETV